MKILVTTSGKVGGDVAEALLSSGYSVRLGARKPEKILQRFSNAEAVHFDYTNPATFSESLKGVDGLFSAAPYHLLPDAETQLFAAANNTGVKKVVKLSALGVEAYDGSPHRVAEKALEASGLEWAVVRPTFFMQNYSTMMAPGIRSQHTFYEPAADGRTSFVDTCDIAAVVVKLLSGPAQTGRAYNLTGSKALSREEVAAVISAEIGQKITYVAVDDAALRQSMRSAPSSLVNLMSGLYGAVRAGHTAAVTSTIKDILGREPTGFETFVRDHANVWRA